MTNKEIAEQLHISPASLSIIINHKRGVSDRTRQRVLQSLQQMGYSDLIKPKSDSTQNKSICFTVYKRTGEILDVQPFFLLLMEAIELRARKYGFNITFSTVDKRLDTIDQVAHLNSVGSKGGIIFATEMLADDIKAFDNYDVPFILMDNDFGNLAVNSVAIDNRMGTFQAVQYLYENGHRNIGYLKSSSPISSFDERDEGYRRAMLSFGIPLQEKNVFHLRYTEDGSYHDFSTILKKKPKLPTAFVTDVDTIAAGARHALNDFGYSIPEDISLIGYDDRPLCVESSPQLTTINVSKTSYANEAVDSLMILMERSENTPVSEQRTRKSRIGTKLIVRDTVKRLS